MSARSRAAVFDLDGTLVDNMTFHGRAWAAVAESLGARATREQFERDWAGKKADEILEILLGVAPAPAISATVEARKEEAYRALYRGRVAPVKGLHAFLERLRGAGVRLALATAAPRDNRTMVLEALGLADAFEVVQGPEGIARGKPAPDIYLGAAARLGLPGDACVAFEDAENGVRAAREAGMAVVALLTGSDEGALRRAGASWALRDYADLPPDLESRLFG